MYSDEEYEVPEGCKLLNQIDLRKLVDEGEKFELDEESRLSVFENQKAKKLEFLEEEYTKIYEDVGDIESFEETLETMTPISEDQGLMKYLIEPGHGPQIQDGFNVEIKYHLFGEDILDPLDSTSFRRKLDFFKVRNREILPVFYYSLLSMRVGERAKFIAEPHYYYGKCGCPPKIPPDLRVQVWIEVVKGGKSAAESNIFDVLEDNNFENCSYDDLINSVSALKLLGNKEYKNKDFDKALLHYKRGLKFIVQIEIRDINRQREETNLLKLLLYSNMAQCSIEEGEYKDALRYCDHGLKIPLPPNKKTKVYYRYAFALNKEGRFNEALKRVNEANRLNAEDKSIQNLYHEVQANILKSRKQKKDLAVRMFQNLNING